MSHIVRAGEISGNRSSFCLLCDLRLLFVKDFRAQQTSERLMASGDPTQGRTVSHLLEGPVWNCVAPS